MPSPDSPPLVQYPDLLIYAVRPNQKPSDARGNLHRHPHFEIAWISQGEAEYFCDFKQYLLKAGSLAFIAPGQLHEWRSDWANFEMIVVGFQTSVFTLTGLDTSLVYELPYFEPGAVPILSPPSNDFQLFDHLFKTLYSQFERFQTNQNQLLSAHLLSALLEAQRVYVESTPSPSLSTANAIAVAFRKEVEKTFSQRIEVQGYANLMGLSSNHLVKTIKKVTGKTPGQIIAERLLLEAKRLLAHSNDSITEISELLSFENPSQFSHWFKKYEHQSPKLFREQFRKA